MQLIFSIFHLRCLGQRGSNWPFYTLLLVIDMSYTDYLAEKQTFGVFFKKGVRPVALLKKDPKTDFLLWILQHF